MISKLHSIAIILVSVFTEFPTTLLLLPVAIVLSDVFASIVRRFTARSGHSEMSIKAAKARQLRDNKRNARGEKFLTKLPSEKQREEILNMTAEQVIAAIKNKNFSCEAILQTFIAQAQKCAKEFNAVTEEPFEEALEAARAVDVKVARGDPLRPLEGLPISVKDCVEQRNCLATCGLASKADIVLKDDGLLVKLLRDAGAIPFVRGNIPQALMLPESDNYVWGRTSNVWNKDRSPGGSSGGDAALVAFRAAPIGIGGDIGGSLRIPASFTGITTLKATPLRVTRSGSHMPRHDPYGSQPSVRAVAGPLTRRVDDLKLIFEHAWWTESAFKGDSTSVPMPFDHKQYNSTKQLTIGYYDDDEYFTPVPACRRAVQEAAEAFKAAGHIVKRFDPVLVREAVMCFYGIMSADGHMAGFYNGLQGEKLLYIYESLATMAFIPAYLRPILAALLKAIGEIRASDLISIAGAKSANEFWHIVSTQTKLVEATLRAMDDANVDVLLTPTTATPAFLHGASKDLTPSVSYTMLWNLLHFPSGVVPTTLVRKDETDPKKYLDSLPVNQRDRYAKHAATQCENSEGLPVGVQIVARPFQDETVLRAMKVLESQLDQQRNGPFPCAPAALK